MWIVQPTQTWTVLRCLYDLVLMHALRGDERTAADDQKQLRDERRRHDVSGKASKLCQIYGASVATVVGGGSILGSIRAPARP